MKRFLWRVNLLLLFIAATIATALAQTQTIIAKCRPDAVLVGQTCVDKYEASLWEIPAASTILIGEVKIGTATLAALQAGGATQISPIALNTGSLTVTFPRNGQWTAPLYAVSIRGVQPAAAVSWFQAAQACAISAKRLPTNAEWQMAAAGTPEGSAGDNGSTNCNTITAGVVVNTGSRSKCRSVWGAFDMVGNVNEIVADWVPRSTTCGSWSGIVSADLQCFAGAATSGEPGALYRGGQWNNGSTAGPFLVYGLNPVTSAGITVGFRCAR
jgi:formylglycine-generating enzyme required for sulfatase activity